LELIDIIMVTAMGPPGGGRHAITPRFLRHFNVISFDNFDEETMRNIFNPICDWHFNQGFDAIFKKFSRVSLFEETVLISVHGYCLNFWLTSASGMLKEAY